MSERSLQLGRDHLGFGELASGSPTPRSAWAISVGSDRKSPGRRTKGSRKLPNEDGLLVVDEGERCLLAVADAHHGISASHDLLEVLAGQLEQVPSSAEELAGHFERLSFLPPVGHHSSATTLVVAIHERAAGRGFGVSFGDSSCALIGAARVRDPRGKPKAPFVSLTLPSRLHISRADTFEFEVAEGELLAVFTDGIDECCYRDRSRSLRPEHLVATWAAAREAHPAALQNAPQQFTEALTRLALAGVDGHPGGQDNIALAVSSAD